MIHVAYFDSLSESNQPLSLGKAQLETAPFPVGRPNSKRTLSRLNNVYFSDQHHNTCDKDHPYSYNKGSHCCATKASSPKNAKKCTSNLLLSLSFLSNPNPIIALPCLLLTHSLTQSVTAPCETWMIWPWHVKFNPKFGHDQILATNLGRQDYKARV